MVGTGYGRYKVTFGNTQVTEISCHGRGAVQMFPGTRTVVDMGGQDTKAIRVAPTGEVRGLLHERQVRRRHRPLPRRRGERPRHPPRPARAHGAARRAGGEDQHHLHRLRGVRGALVAGPRQEDRGHPARRAPVHRRALGGAGAARRHRGPGHLHRRRRPERGDDRDAEPRRSASRSTSATTPSTWAPWGPRCSPSTTSWRPARRPRGTRHDHLHRGHRRRLDVHQGGRARRRAPHRGPRDAAHRLPALRDRRADPRRGGARRRGSRPATCATWSPPASAGTRSGSATCASPT